MSKLHPTTRALLAVLHAARGNDPLCWKAGDAAAVRNALSDWTRSDAPDLDDDANADVLAAASAYGKLLDDGRVSDAVKLCRITDKVSENAACAKIARLMLDRTSPSEARKILVDLGYLESDDQPKTSEPDALGLHHDRVHRDVGRGRPANAARIQSADLDAEERAFWGRVFCDTHASIRSEIPEREAAEESAQYADAALAERRKRWPR